MQVPDHCIHEDDVEPLIHDGTYDDAVLRRARVLGWSAPDDARADAEADVGVRA